jgi:hypothetical protein
MRRPWIMFSIGFLVLVAACVVWYTKVRPTMQSRQAEIQAQQRAMDCWRELVANGFKSEGQEIDSAVIEAALEACFKVGDPASKYESLFAHAEKRFTPDGVLISYYWEKRTPFIIEDFDVVVWGDPATIRSANRGAIDFISLDF